MAKKVSDDTPGGLLSLSKSDRSLCKKWSKAVTAADKVQREWSDEFLCDILYDYWKGHQWQDDGKTENKRYTINLCYASMETRLPSLAFYKPRIRITPRPNRTDDPMSMSGPRMKLLEDTANTLIADPEASFIKTVQLCVRDAHFRFGVMEVGYSADAVDNPNKGKPIKDPSGTEMRDSEGASVVEPDKVIQKESIYFRMIPAKQFRVGVSDKNFLRDNDWWGYYEFHHIEDVLSNKKYNNLEGVKAKARGLRGTPGQSTSDTTGAIDEDTQKDVQGQVKLWKIWSPREKTRYIFTDDFDRPLLQEPYECRQHSVMKFHESVDSFYPMPPLYNWIWPQMELNETREMQRVHRKRYTRRYLRRPGAFTEEEMAKLESGEDGVYAEVNGSPADALVPVPDAPLDRAIVAYVNTAKEDFMQVSGVGGEQRGVSEADTATQANIIDVNNKMRESFHRQEVADFISDIVTNMLHILITYANLDIWVQTNVDMTSPGGPMEVQSIQQQWQQIKIESLGTELNWQCQVDVESLTPVTEDQLRNQWNQLMGIIADPGVQPLLLASDTILRKTCNLYGIRNEREVQDIKMALMTVFQGRMLEQMAASGQMPMPPGGQPGAQGGAGPSAPPPQAQVQAGRQEQMS